MSSSATSCIQTLSSIISSVPSSSTLLHDPTVSAEISSLIRHPDSGSGDNSLCRWLYDTFHSTDPELKLVVIRYVPIIAGVYLTRIAHRKSLAGFEAILLALYANETTARDGQPVSVNVPDLSQPSIYHDAKGSVKNKATELNLAVISPTLEPHGTMRSSRRSRIVGVALELYYSNISQMPVRSKIEFCEFCDIWASGVKNERRIPLPWDLLQPSLRILGHCLLGSHNSKELLEAASSATLSLYRRSLHDIDAKAILATGSLLRLEKMFSDPKLNVDHTEIDLSNVLSL